MTEIDGNPSSRLFQLAASNQLFSPRPSGSSSSSASAAATPARSPTVVAPIPTPSPNHKPGPLPGADWSASPGEHKLPPLKVRSCRAFERALMLSLCRSNQATTRTSRCRLPTAVDLKSHVMILRRLRAGCSSANHANSSLPLPLAQRREPRVASELAQPCLASRCRHLRAF